MAIPFKIPNQQPMSEQQIRELYDLLQHLMIVCQQQILAVEAVRNRASVTTTPPTTTVSYERRVLSTLSAALQSNQQIRRQRVKRTDSGCQKPNEAPLPLLTFEGELWIRVGSDLRKIADEFDVTLEQRSEAILIGGGDEVDSPLPRRSEQCPSRCSILLKLLPRPSFIMGSICTAVIFVGWHLLQNR